MLYYQAACFFTEIFLQWLKTFDSLAFSVYELIVSLIYFTCTFMSCIFSLGRRRLLKCLLEVHSLLIDTDSRYILNDLYITDYCVWIQSAR